jgi:hypothetical protein
VIYSIKKGKHYSRPIRLGFWWGRDRFQWHVLFLPDCRYSIEGEDMADINKLIGVGYLPSHHKNSARFGWRYDSDKDKIELFAYCYVSGVRIYQYMCDISIGSRTRISLTIEDNKYVFEVGNFETSVLHNNKHKFQYLLRPYFGGNKTAPHNITIELL